MSNFLKKLLDFLNINKRATEKINKIKSVGSDHYILENEQIKKVDESFDFYKWFSEADRKISEDKIRKATISTVFLGLDHGFGGKLLLFETAVFGEKLELDFGDRYSTLEEARIGHKKIVEEVRERIEKKESAKKPGVRKIR